MKYQTKSGKTLMYKGKALTRRNAAKSPSAPKKYQRKPSRTA